MYDVRCKTSICEQSVHNILCKPYIARALLIVDRYILHAHIYWGTLQVTNMTRTVCNKCSTTENQLNIFQLPLMMKVRISRGDSVITPSSASATILTNKYSTSLSVNSYGYKIYVQIYYTQTNNNLCCCLKGHCPDCGHVFPHPRILLGKYFNSISNNQSNRDHFYIQTYHSNQDIDIISANEHSSDWNVP